jgi:hypothetical protein
MSRTRISLSSLAALVLLLLASSSNLIAADNQIQPLAVQPGAFAHHAVVNPHAAQIGATVLRVNVPGLPPDATVQTAVEILQKARLTPGNFLCDPASGSPNAVAGRVTGFSPASGTVVAVGAKVDMYAVQPGKCALAHVIIPPTAFHVAPHTMSHEYHGAPGANFDVLPGAQQPAPPPPPPADQTAVNTSTATATQNASAEVGADELSKAGIQTGYGAFVKPGDMVVGSSYPLEFVAGPTTKALVEEAEGEQLDQAHHVYVARQMRVTLLRNPAFKIDQVGNPIQDTGPDLTATWDWNVTPLTDGPKQLRAKVEVGVKQPDGSINWVENKERVVPITVRVGTWQGFINALKNASSLGDVLGTLFRSWEKTLGALAALIIAALGVRTAIRKWGKGSA